MTTLFKNLIGVSLVLCSLSLSAQVNLRRDVLLNDNWYSIASDSNQHAYDGFEASGFNITSWEKVNVPHNWDAYGGYRRLRHGNRHGYAWYRRIFSVLHKEKDKRYFLYFEGVGSYATVWVNGKQAGQHAGGRTTFTLDVTDLIKDNNQPNTLAVRADHPAFITDLPWVCGGCSDERGFSEGSQPMGIFRPVHLITTSSIRIEPFGVHIWNDTSVSEQSAILHLETTVRNYSTKPVPVTITQQLLNKAGQVIVTTTSSTTIQPGDALVTPQQLPEIKSPHLWSVNDPWCYTLVTTISQNGKPVDAVSTPYGIRWISWPIGRTGSNKQFLLNGKPVFINGIAEYEHMIGSSHAFSEAEITARMQQIKAVGFNAFRDAHQPHNLRYQHLLDSMGILWWTQLSAHIWYDSPEFRRNFKTLLKEWVIERRNSPSLILWGLQNESKLPEDFAKECTQLIRELDPTTSSQRKVTTCNGGSGTDWDVPQNWTGTYGGNPATYASDVKKQLLIGEYGAWRTLDLHTEGGFVQNGIFSEDRMTQLMEWKVRLAESVKDSTCGQFFWIYTSHDNPGRAQSGEGYRDMDRIGPVNYKGLLTPWEEPLDVFYMYRANYAPKETSPMVYIVSHTWPDRWTSTGIKDSITIYSNCDEVELFNDVNDHSLGKQTRKGIGTHFQWDHVNIQYNVLYAVGYVNGKKVATDYIVLHHLPQAPHFNAFYSAAVQRSDRVSSPSPSIGATKEGRAHYIYRVNCGGSTYLDQRGHTWAADREKRMPGTWGSISWTKQFEGMPSFFASQRQTNDPIRNTSDWPLYQTFRYGLQQLKYEFPVPDGDYIVELYFTEPWWGTGGGINCTGWRLFDVAINNKTVIKDLDIWKESGHDGALKKTVNVHITGGQLQISFPRISAGQAIISAIAIASLNKQVKPAPASPTLIDKLIVSDSLLFPYHGSWGGPSWQSWLNTGDQQYVGSNISFSELPSNLYEAEWIQTPLFTSSENLPQGWAGFTLTADADVYIALDARITQLPEWMKDYEDTKTFCKNDFHSGTSFKLYRKRFPSKSVIALGANGQLQTGTDTALMYTVFATPVTTLQPPFDLKPTISYKMAQAVNSEKGTSRKTVSNKDAVVFTEPANGTVDWAINPGVADVYSLSFRYLNLTSKAGRIKWQLIAADGTIMKTESMDLPPVREGKWSSVTTTTGTMINAGKYTVRITAEDANDIAISGLDVQ